MITQAQGTMRQASDIAMTAFNSPVGVIYMAFSGTALVGIDFDRPDKALLHRGGKDNVSSAFRKQLEAYFKGASLNFDQAFKFFIGTAFEQKVWLSLRDIPVGETRTYKWLAEKAGSPRAVRAVGQALAKNPLPILLPCHRIISSDGSIGGYSPRIEIKEWLLRHEALYLTRHSRK